MSNKRIARLNEQIKREVSEILRRQVRDPRVGLVTVTRVEVTGDLSLARILVRVAGDDADWSESMAGLEAAAPFIRRTLGGALHVRRVPELQFREDRALDHALRIEEILDDISVPPPEEGDPDTEAEG